MPNYSGKWNLNGQLAGIKQGTWTGIVTPIYKLFAIGDNGLGQIGDDSIIDRSSPIQVGAEIDWDKVATGDTHSLALKRNGTLWAWGDNTNGRLGDSSAVSKSSPIQIGTDTDWQKIFGTSGSSFAIKTDGSLYAWGLNTFGRLGIGIGAAQSSPTQVGALTNWSQVDGDFHTMAVKTDGTLWAWGEDDWGKLGINLLVNTSSPTQVGADTDWYKVAGADDHTAAIKTDGTLWTWGVSSSGRLGNNDDSRATDRSSPVQVGLDTDWADISAAGQFNLALKSDGSLWSWGANNVGQLGTGNTTYRSSPVQVGLLTNWQSIYAGAGNMAGAIKSDGTLWLWGDNSHGQLFDGTKTNRNSPIQVGTEDNWYEVALNSNDHILVIQNLSTTSGVS